MMRYLQIATLAVAAVAVLHGQSAVSGLGNLSNSNLPGNGTTTVDGQSCTLGSTCQTNFAATGDAIASAKVMGTTSGKAPVAATAGDVGTILYVTGGGTAQAQTATLSPAVTSLVAGLEVNWLPAAANSGAGPTLAVNGLTATNITKCGTVALVANDLVTTAVASVIFDGTRFELQNPNAAPCGTGGGNVTAGTLTTNTIPKATGPTSIGDSAVTDNGTTLGIASNFSITESSGVLAKVAGITTVGEGVPILGWVSNVTGVTASQGTVTLATAPGAGMYRIHYYADPSTLCATGSNSVAFTFNWGDVSNARALTTGSLTLPSAQTTSAFLSGTWDIWLAAATNVTYTSTITGTCTTGGPSAYDVHVSLERLQ